MLNIKMEDESVYKFANGEYTDYEVKKDFLVIYDDEKWKGVFAMEHFVALWLEDEE